MSGVHFLERGAAGDITALLSSWREAHPRMGVLALAAEADRKTTVPVLQECCRTLEVPLRGAVFPGLVARSRFANHGCVLLRFDVMPFAEIYELPSGPALEESVRRIAGELSQRLGEPRRASLFMVFDAMVANISTILDELYLGLADRVRYFGANAGSERFQPMPCLFDNRRETSNGALMVLLPDHPGAVVEHCYRAPARMISATSTAGNRIISIDWQPAFEVYREVVEAEFGVTIGRDNFYQLAVHFPFGILRANDEVVVRMPVALEDDGSVFCVGEVPPNALLTLMRAAEVDSARTLERLGQGIEALFGDPAGRELLTFYCAGRRIHLADRAQDELSGLASRTGAAQVTGAVSLGEIGHSLQWGYPAFHNGALVCCGWGAP
jgi:hypothetical protein